MLTTMLIALRLAARESHLRLEKARRDQEGGTRQPLTEPAVAGADARRLPFYTESEGSAEAAAVVKLIHAGILEVAAKNPRVDGPVRVVLLGEEVAPIEAIQEPADWIWCECVPTPIYEAEPTRILNPPGSSAVMTRAVGVLSGARVLPEGMKLKLESR
jgi:hypothetical protein